MADAVSTTFVVVSHASAPEFPDALLFGPLTNEWELVAPIAVTIERDDDGSYVVSDQLFGIYGSGQSERDALRDYSTSLAEYSSLVHARRTNHDVAPLARSLFAFVGRCSS